MDYKTKASQLIKMSDEKNVNINIETPGEHEVKVNIINNKEEVAKNKVESFNPESEEVLENNGQKSEPGTTIENIEPETVEAFKDEAESKEKSGGIFAKLKGNKKEKAKEKLAGLENELAEQKDKNLRLFAEFDNFKKRTAKERIELFKTAGKDVVVDMLSVLDDFERANKAANEARENKKEVDLEGFNLIYNKIKNTLGNKGLKEMETNGEDFNPDLHDAITEIPAPSDDLKGKIVDTIEKGYYMSDVIIRHAKVVIGK